MLLKSGFVFGLITLLFVAGTASAASCRGKSKSPDIAFEKLWPKVSYGNNKSSKDLDNLGRNRHHTSTNGPGRAGVTQRKSRFAYEMRLSSYRLSDGSHCMGIKKIKLRYGFDTMKVYIAKKYRKQECKYQAILKHENTHVKINADILDKFSKRFRDDMRAQINGINFRKGRNLKEVKKRIGKEITADLNRQSRLFQKMLEKEHAKIDTSESYRKVHASC